mgnify:CR=1 FL=1
MCYINVYNKKQLKCKLSHYLLFIPFIYELKNTEPDSSTKKSQLPPNKTKETQVYLEKYNHNK